MPTYFTTAFYQAIAKQQAEGTVCNTCGRTEIEHVFSPSKCCSKRNSGKPLDEEEIK